MMLMLFGFCQQIPQKISKAGEELKNNILITGILNRCLHSNLHKSLLEKFCIYILVTELQKSHSSKCWHFGSCINIDMFSNTWMSERIFNASCYSHDKHCCQAKVLLNSNMFCFLMYWNYYVNCWLIQKIMLMLLRNVLALLPRGRETRQHRN